MCKEVVEKVVNAKVKTSLQPPLRTKKIDSKCLKDYRLVKKDEANRNHWNNRDKNKSIQNLSLTNTSQA